MDNIEKLAREMAEQMFKEMMEKEKDKNKPSIIPIDDERLNDRVEKAISKLEAYFPEKKVFALDSIDSKLRETLSELYLKIGYDTFDDLLNAYGYEIISRNEVKKIREFVKYTPGNEPNIIKGKVESMLKRLDEYYPEHIISRSIQNDHKNLSNSVSGLYQWLGYDNCGDMLRAYGYEYNVLKCGRIANDYNTVLNILKGKYNGDHKAKNMGTLMFENPDIKGQIKTLNNKANELFGMTLSNYLKQIGVLQEGIQRSSFMVSDEKKQDVIETFRKRYETFNENEHGDVEEAVRQLDGMNLKQNQTGEIYIFNANNCNSEIVIPYGIDKIKEGAFSYLKNITSVEIKADIKEIECRTFSNCTSLKSVVLPDSLERISAYAFMNCESLSNVKFPDRAVIVRDTAFIGCPFEYIPKTDELATDKNSFTYSVNKNGYATITGYIGSDSDVIIPSIIDGNPVKSIAKNAFAGNNYLTSVCMPDSITEIANFAFKDCKSLKCVNLSNNISKINSGTFNGCIGLEEINIPDAVNEIIRNTFNVSPLKKIHIGKSLKKIDSRCFYKSVDSSSTNTTKYRKIKKISVDENNPYLKAYDGCILSKDGKILYTCLSSKNTYEIPEGVEIINEYSFYDLKSLTDITFPKSLLEIGAKAFHGISLRNIVLGENVRKIGVSAFENCYSLTSVVLNDRIEEIDAKAFKDCHIYSLHIPESLRKLDISSFSKIFGSSHSYYGTNEKIKLSIDLKNKYFASDGHGFYSISETGKTLVCIYNKTKSEYSVAAGTTHISEMAFEQNNTITKIILPEGLISIGNKAFYYCYQLNDINLPESLEEIGYKAFAGTQIKSFSIGSNLRTIGNGALLTGDFYQSSRTKLRSIKVSKANTQFYTSKKALYQKNKNGTESLVIYYGGDKVLSIPEGVNEICYGAFERSIVHEIVIPASITNIQENAFLGCKNLNRIYIELKEAEKGVNRAVIYIPQVEANNYSTIREHYTDCIRCEHNGLPFDFIKYDSLFNNLRNVKEKILIATDRLKSAINLIPLYEKQYLSYLKRNAKKAVEIVVEFDDLTGLHTLAELDLFTGENIDSLIEIANKAQKTEILSYLMNYKNSTVGIDEIDYDL